MVKMEENNYRDKTHETLWDFHRAILGIYHEQELTSLGGLKREFILHDRQVLAWYSQVTRKAQINNTAFNFHTNFYFFVIDIDNVGNQTCTFVQSYNTN